MIILNRSKNSSYYWIFHMRFFWNSFILFYWIRLHLGDEEHSSFIVDRYNEFWICTKHIFTIAFVIFLSIFLFNFCRSLLYLSIHLHFFFTYLSLPAFSFPLSVFLSVLFVRPSAYRHHSTCPPTTAPLFLLLYLNYYSIDHSHRSPSISSTFSLHKFFFTTSFPLPPSFTPPFSSFSYLLYSTLFLPLYSILSYILLSLILSPPLPFPSSFNSSYTLSSIFHSIIPSQSHPVLRTVPMWTSHLTLVGHQWSTPVLWATRRKLLTSSL